VQLKKSSIAKNSKKLKTVQNGTTPKNFVQLCEINPSSFKSKKNPDISMKRLD
jgi:hypothetical protein